MEASTDVELRLRVVFVIDARLLSKKLCCWKEPVFQYVKLVGFRLGQGSEFV